MAMLYQPPNRLAILAVLASIWLFPGLALAPWHSIKMPFQQKKRRDIHRNFARSHSHWRQKGLHKADDA
jgi:hypothetical protein